jgi:hypothetical protein
MNRNNGFLRQPIFTTLDLVKNLNDDQGLELEDWFIVVHLTRQKQAPFRDDRTQIAKM